MRKQLTAPPAPKTWPGWRRRSRRGRGGVILKTRSAIRLTASITRSAPINFAMRPKSNRAPTPRPSRSCQPLSARSSPAAPDREAGMIERLTGKPVTCPKCGEWATFQWGS